MQLGQHGLGEPALKLVVGPLAPGTAQGPVRLKETTMAPCVKMIQRKQKNRVV